MLRHRRSRRKILRRRPPPQSPVSFRAPFFPALHPLETNRRATRQQERNKTQDAEGAINQSPPHRYPADLAEHERIRNDQQARDDPEIDHPLVSYRITKRPNERNRD